MDAHRDALATQPDTLDTLDVLETPDELDALEAFGEPAASVEAEPADEVAAPSEPGPFARWFRSRPVIGGLITVIGGIAMFFSSQLQLGGMTVHVGIEGAQAMILPAVLIVCGALAIFSPAQHVFYGIVAMIISVYSLVGVNLGGFFIGFLLGSIGGIVVASWRRKGRHVGDDEEGADAAGSDAELAPGEGRE